MPSITAVDFLYCFAIKIDLEMEFVASFSVYYVFSLHFNYTIAIITVSILKILAQHRRC